ncbi:glycoside hydrolase family 3 C-terminal domain-containing protein [Mycoplasmatota bacterium]|nr:glycoside hydrolase family 3 C-terminal domain-containing protein [Mycoplasmatota bacterium]
MEIISIIEKMTLEEKASLCSGKNVWETQEINRLSIPSIMMADGPHGLRKQYDKSDNLGNEPSYPSTCFPPAATTACSFDRKLIKQMGEAIAFECRYHDIDIILGPGVNIKRSPLCGRNFEYFSEDPYLSGELGASFVSGVQENGIGVSLKHFVANNQEKLRQVISSEIDERALREIYLTSFERIMKEKPYTVMCSYNRINGEYASENKYLLNDILRDEWGFDGVVVTDWGACNDRVLGLENGQDLEMPTSFGINDQLIIDAVKNGTLDERVLNKTVERLLNLIYNCKKSQKVIIKKDHHLLAKEVADQSMVLLKNEMSILPIKPNQSIGIIGEMAYIPRYQGSGSSKINPIKLENVCDVLSKKNIDFTYARGYSIDSDDINHELLIEAIEVAKSVDVPIIFIGLTEKYESEGFDREHMDLPQAHNHLVEEITKINPNVVIILSGGSPVTMPWINHVKGILNAYLGGESGALSIVDILYGNVNPSGKLAETYPLKLEHTPTFNYFPGGNNSVYYVESIYVGYRYYEKKEQEVLFPFGHGLSYTTFSYQNLRLNKSEILENKLLEVSFTIKNTGIVAGKEICQLYVRDIESSVFKPVKELKGFEKINLLVGEEKKITFKLDKRTFAYYHITLKDWVVESGDYEICIGSSSKDIHLKTIVNIKPLEKVVSPYQNIDLHHYESLKHGFNSETYEILLSRKLPPLNKKLKRPYTFNSTLGDVSHTFVGRIILWMVKKQIKKISKDESTRLMRERSLIDLPFRSLVSFSGGTFKKEMADGLLELINRRYIKVLRKLLKLSKNKLRRKRDE